MISEAQLFRWLRWRLLAHGFETLRLTAKARLVTVIICTLVIAGVVFAVAFEGFWFMNSQQLPSGGLIIQLLFDFMFLTLGIMLVFSGGLILYGSLFATPESAFLLALPAHADRVFAYKFSGALGFSSWAFILLGLPVLAAYGLAYNVSWLFWPALPAFLIGFVLLPGSIGALACLLIVNLAPKQRRQILIALIIILIAAVGVFCYNWAWKAIHVDVTSRDALTDLIGQLTFAHDMWVPTHWVTSGLLAAVHGNRQEVLMNLALVWSNGLFAFVIAAWLSRKLYRRGYNRLQTGGDLRKRYGASRLDHWLEHLLSFLDRPTRLLIVKDFRSFRRDPGQWLQVVIYAGLALTYFANSRQFYRSDLGIPFQHGVAWVNLLATSMLLCAYMGRFVYPMLSLEGRKFWVLGLMPIKRRQLLFGKFAFAAVGALFVAFPLILASDLLLGLSIGGVLLHCLTVVVVVLGLSGLAVGIGAILPNFRESDPSKIAVGFGGTMNLLAGLLFLLLEMVLIAGPYHLNAMLYGEMNGYGMKTLQFIGIALGLAVAAAATLLPLRAGIRTLEAMEF